MLPETQDLDVVVVKELNWDKETNQVGGYSDCKTCRYCFGVVKRRCFEREVWFSVSMRVCSKSGMR
jgi:hypothetical protein